MIGNVITANFRCARTTTTSPLWQYDYGQFLRFTGVSLPDTYEVHFSNNKEFGQAKTSIGTAEGVLIPDEYLVTGKPVFAWIFLHVGEDDGETVYMAQIPVRKRSVPSDEPPTPQEQSAITQAIAALNSAVVDVQEAVGAADSARASATSAASSATAAAASEAGVEADADRASNAATAAESAQTAAEAAQTGAETAQTGAESARDEAAEASTAQIAQINATGAAVLESIPADYTELSEDVSNLKSDYINSLISIFPKSEWSNGYFDNAGTFKPNVNYATPTSAPFEVVYGEKLLIEPNGYTITVRIYDESGGAYSTRTALTLTSQQIIQFPTATYVSIHAFNGGSSINPLTCGVRIYNVNPLKVSVDSIGKSNNALIVGNSVFDASVFSNGGLSSGAFASQTYRVSCYDTLLSFDYPITIKAKTGFKFGVHTFVNGTFSADSGWQTAYSIPAHTTFKIVIARESETTSEIANVDNFVSQLYFNSKIQYEISTMQPSAYMYDVVGEPINLKRQAYNTSVIRNIIWPVTGVTNPQGFAIYNDVLFQFYSDDVVILSDFTDGTQIIKLSITSGHGDTVDFSKEFYEASDEFPLIYSTADTTPCVVYVNRITRASATLIRTYKFPDVTQTGYYAGHCLDSDANVLYLVGYKENSYYLNPNDTNNMIVSSWDLGNCVTNSDGTFTPTFIDSFEIPFIITVQGQRFFDNKLFLLSSNASGGIATNTIIYVVDPTRKKVVTRLESFPTQLKTYECQGIEFVENSECYDMVISGYGKYYRLTFNQ